MLKHVALAALLLMAGPVLAETASGETCSTIDNEPRRLICYDLIFKVGSTSTPLRDSAPAFAQQVPNWPMTTRPSRLGDGMTVTIATVSSEPITEDQQMARMSVGCDDDRTSVTFNFSGYFIADTNGGNILKASIDDGEPLAVETIASDSIVILFGGAKSIPFLKTLLAGEELRLKVQPTSGPPVEAEFALDGLSQAIRPIQQACNWS